MTDTAKLRELLSDLRPLVDVIAKRVDSYGHPYFPGVVAEQAAPLLPRIDEALAALPFMREAVGVRALEWSGCGAADTAHGRYIVKFNPDAQLWDESTTALFIASGGERTVIFKGDQNSGEEAHAVCERHAAQYAAEKEK